ncbi:hypothetical protein I5E68_09810 [Novosphingobium sp. YJ-S2-02]|uniref:Uncharacterized protein n=1 Tax=Novosphingobium aureum TaxID=2792964 RepID=A0A931HC16_9SPHN|nr:hypothetical protein [Novosphingobium aureum]MBH0113240.1 hypothetical protein [Novosphingobium aureum]
MRGRSWAPWFAYRSALRRRTRALTEVRLLYPAVFVSSPPHVEVHIPAPQFLDLPLIKKIVSDFVAKKEDGHV